MPPSPLVSVITPAYNAARFIEETVRSVLSQSFPDFEMLVVDDCSPDETAAIVGRLAAQDRRVTVLRHPRNLGPAAAREAAIEAARGRYIAFLDSDDLWLPDKLEVQLRFMEEVGAVISYTQYRRITDSGRVISGPVPVPSRLDYRQLLRNTAMATSTVIVDRDRTGSFRMTRTYYDDFALWLDILRRGFVAHGLLRDLVRYRVVAGSVSRNKLRSAWHVWRLYRDIEHLTSADALWCSLRRAWNGYRRYRA